MIDVPLAILQGQIPFHDALIKLKKCLLVSPLRTVTENLLLPLDIDESGRRPTRFSHPHSSVLILGKVGGPLPSDGHDTFCVIDSSSSRCGFMAVLFVCRLLAGVPNWVRI